MCRLLILLGLAMNSVSAQGLTQDAASGPAQLLITYRCPPPRRAAFRQYMNELGIQRFEHWKQDGVLKDYRFLFNWYVDVDTWDAMAVLTFPDSAAVAHWRDIEKSSPGGLARDGIDMAWPLTESSADLLAGDAFQLPSPAGTIYFVVPYDTPAGTEYRDYAASVLLPQAKGWMKEGLLTSYRIYANRYPGGKRWQGLLLLEYKDAQALGRRDEVNAKVRAQLRNDPAWKSADAKLKATEREPVLADPVVSH